MNDLQSYKAFLKAQEAAEQFLISHSKDDSVHARIRYDEGLEKVRALAKHLGFELVPVAASQKEAA